MLVQFIQYRKKLERTAKNYDEAKATLDRL